MDTAKLFISGRSQAVRLKFGELPGNVILRKGEANLSKKCVVNTTQIKSVDKRSIKEKVGTLSKKEWTKFMKA